MRESFESADYMQRDAVPSSIDLVGDAHAPMVSRRSSPRRPVRWNAVAYCRGRARGMHVVVRNISRGGMMLENAFGAMVSDRVRVVLLSGRAIEGRVMWTVSPYCGFRFDGELAEDDPLLTAK